MNQINPKKLLNSKWTAVYPDKSEMHFLVTDVKFSDEGKVIHCILEAILTKNTKSIQWQQLKDSDHWLFGWQ